MFLRYILVLFMVILFIAFVSTAEAPCDNNAHTGEFSVECKDHKEKILFGWDTCVDNKLEGQDGEIQCIKPGYAFDTEEECKGKCKDEDKGIPYY